jgi:hypothetical protein
MKKGPFFVQHFFGPGKKSLFGSLQGGEAPLVLRSSIVHFVPKHLFHLISLRRTCKAISDRRVQHDMQSNF